MRGSDPNQDQLDFAPPVENEAVRAFVAAAKALDGAGDTAQAELRFRQALRAAQTSTGPQSEDVRCVTTLLASFYRRNARLEDATQLEQSPVPAPRSRRTLESTFVKRRNTLDSSAPQAIMLPPDIRKACQVLGLSAEQAPSPQEVTKAWKQSVVQASGHPDLGGHAELSILLNTSKDAVLQWLDSKLQRIGKFESLPAAKAGL
jgi:hypothetical protein